MDKLNKTQFELRGKQRVTLAVGCVGSYTTLGREWLGRRKSGSKEGGGGEQALVEARIPNF